MGSVQQIVDQAWALIKADNGHDALIVLEAVTQATIRQGYLLTTSVTPPGTYADTLRRVCMGSSGSDF